MGRAVEGLKLAQSGMTSAAGLAGTEALPDWQTQQYHASNMLPWNCRGVVGLARLLMAWVAAIYTCPYAGCTFLSPSSMKGQYVIRPDRTCDFIEHWYVTHMATTLKYRCLVAWCSSLAVLFKTAKRFREPLVKHYKGARVSDAATSGLVKQAHDDFAECSGDEPDTKAVAAAVTYPPNHVTAAQYKKIEADNERATKVQEEADRKIQKEQKKTAEKKKAEEERVKKAADRKTAEADARKKEETRRVEERATRYHDAAATSDRKRDAQPSTSAHPMKRAKHDLVTQGLSIGPRDDRLPIGDVKVVTGSFSAIQAAHKMSR